MLATENSTVFHVKYKGNSSQKRIVLNYTANFNTTFIKLHYKAQNLKKTKIGL